MNAGLSNLYTLKTHLLGGSMVVDTQFDTVITAIGLGMAAHIENLCQRKLARAVGTTEVLPADYSHFPLQRFPLESVSSIELKLTEADGWETLTLNDVVSTIDLTAGIVFMAANADAGPFDAQLRFTYTGGYWWETKEPTDSGYPTTQPTGSTALPDDLRAAWLLQCQEVWNKRDKIGLGLVDKPNQQTTLDTLQLIPLVRVMIQDYVRNRHV